MTTSDEEEEEEEATCIVVDIGSQTCRAGFAGDDEPRASFPMALSHSTGAAEDWRVGDDGDGVKFPVKDGVVEDWDGMEKIWHQMFSEKLRVDPENCRVLICDSPNSPKQNREKFSEMLLWKFGIDGIYFAFQQTLSLYSSGQLTGTVMDMGYQRTTIVPIHYGDPYPQPYLGSQLPIGGYHVTNYLMELLRLDQLMPCEQLRRPTAVCIKESLCRVAIDFGAEVDAFTDNMGQQYKLPDGSHVLVGDEMLRATELLFDPSPGGIDSVGVHQGLVDLINKKIDSAERVPLYGNILLSGGSSLFPGMQQRLNKEISELAPAKIHRKEVSVKVSAPPERRFSAWIGGSILGSLSTMENLYVTRAEYEENGPRVLHKKCS